MIRKLLLVGMFFLCGCGVNAHARGVDLSLSDESAQFVYLFASDSQIGVGGSEVGLGVLSNDADDVLVNFSFLVVGGSTGRNRALQLGAGAKAYVAKLDQGPEDSISAIGIGGKVSYIFPSRTPLAVSLEGFLAPDITSFSDNEDLVELVLRFEVEVAPTAHFYLGYRSIETELSDTGTDYEIDESGHLGVRFSF